MDSHPAIRAGDLFEILLRRPWSSLIAALRSEDRWSRRNRRLAELCDVADLLGIVRPKGWRARQRRLYFHIIRRSCGLAGLTPAESSEIDLPTAARQAMRAAPSAMSRIGQAVLSLVVVVGGLVSLACLLAALFVPPLRQRIFPPDLAKHAHWKASSAFPGTPLEGDRATAPEGFFVHTEFQDNPTVIFDFGRVVSIGKVRIRNRADCCQERTLPLNVEVPDGKAGWRLICQRRTPFSTWSCEPKGIRSQTLRLRLPARNALHLKSVEVFP